MDSLALHKDLFLRAIRKYGADMQKTVCIEELAELQKELSKSIRGKGDTDNIAEEIADVLITVEQMILLFDCRDEVERQIQAKTLRLILRMGESER